MVEDRLNGLAVIYIHPEVNVDPEVVVNDCALGKRKLEFVLWMCFVFVYYNRSIAFCCFDFTSVCIAYTLGPTFI